MHCGIICGRITPARGNLEHRPLSGAVCFPCVLAVPPEVGAARSIKPSRYEGVMVPRMVSLYLCDCGGVPQGDAVPRAAPAPGHGSSGLCPHLQHRHVFQHIAIQINSFNTYINMVCHLAGDVNRPAHAGVH